MIHFPSFELAYETKLSNKTLPIDYTIRVVIPNGKKYYAWFSYSTEILSEFPSVNACFLLELNKEKRVGHLAEFEYHGISIAENVRRFTSLSTGTVVYGTLYETDVAEFNSSVKKTSIFIIEDIYYYHGIKLTNISFGSKLPYLKNVMSQLNSTMFSQKNAKFMTFALAVMSSVGNRDDETPAYPPHHIQYRKNVGVAPYLNSYIDPRRKPSNELDELLPKLFYLPSKYSINMKKPQYNYKTLFSVRADIQFDIYHLYALDFVNSRPVLVYYQIAYIPNLKTSVFMNGLFRNIRENSNLDYIEESDDESDFENMTEDKYVDLNKNIVMECSFSHKFKKWVPLRVMMQGNVCNISKLV